MTVCYDASSGAELWLSRYDGPADGRGGAYALVVAHDGSRVYVTGASEGVGTGLDYATVAIDASNGATVWAARFDSAGGEDLATAIALSGDDTRLYVTGTLELNGAATDFGTIAYDSATGAQQWMRRYNGPANGRDWGQLRSLGQDGSRLYVSGASDGVGTGLDYATIAYSTE